jgi:type I restriction enzyme, S subunit
MELVAEKYKQTEFGLIPEDWDVKQFIDVMDGFSSGQTPYRAIKEYYRGGIPWITSGELNYNVILDTIEKITIEGAKAANLKMIPKGTFLFAITGLEAEGTRGSCAITGIEATTNQSCMALYPKKGKLTTEYLFHYYVRYGKSLALEYCQGTKQQSYTGGIAKKLPIILPPSITEQKAIATALNDADNYISHLEKLIIKKHLIKQGAMQQLLTPKENLASTELKNLIDINRKIRYGIVQPGKYDPNGRYMVRGQDYSFGWVDEKQLFKVSDIVEEKYKNARLKANDLIMTIVGTVGHVEIVPKWLNGANITQTTARIAIDPSKANYIYCKYYFESENGKTQIKRCGSAGIKYKRCRNITGSLSPASRTNPHRHHT